jgi:hypothetical protein
METPDSSQRHDGGCGEPLAAPGPIAALPRARLALLAALLLAALAPRAFMAWRIDVLVPDGVYYIETAQRLERGEYAAALHELRLNFYPLVLAGLHGLGLEWETAARLWGVAVSSLVVLPLFGLVRRQFNDRVAVVAALLYAWHPQFVEWSPETIREPTYWLLMVLLLWLAWRGVTELRAGWLVAAGLAWAAAVHVRTEGWLLGGVCLAWIAFRWLAVQSGHWRLALGTAGFLAAVPALLVFVNLTLLAGHDRWEWGRFNHLEWLLSGQAAHSEAVAAVAPDAPRPATANTAQPSGIARASTPSADDIAEAAPAGEAAASAPHATSIPALDAPAPRPDRPLRVYVLKLGKSFGLVFGLLFWIGAWQGRRLLFRRSQLALLAANAALLWAVWRYLQQWGEINSRYFFPAVLTAMPYAAIGAEAACAWLGRAAARLRLPTPRPLVTPVAVAVLLGIVGCADALTNDLSDRRAQRDLGRWIEHRLGPGRRVAGTPAPRIVAYYARGTAAPLQRAGAGERGAARPVVIVLPTDWQLDEAGQAPLPPDLATVPRALLPADCQELTLCLPVQECRRLAGVPNGGDARR